LKINLSSGARVSLKGRDLPDVFGHLENPSLFPFAWWSGISLVGQDFILRPVFNRPLRGWKSRAP
jgi:hypothetical protein